MVAIFPVARVNCLSFTSGRIPPPPPPPPPLPKHISGPSNYRDIRETGPWSRDSPTSSPGRFSLQSQAKGPWGRGWGFPCLVGHMQHPPADQSRTLSAILGNSSMYSLLYHQSYLQNATLIAKTTNFKIVLSYLASITEK